MSWDYNQVSTGCAVLLHLDAFTATIMAANVFLITMPNQLIVVADLRAGRAREIYLQSAISHVMINANITGLHDADRIVLAAWHKAGQ